MRNFRKTNGYDGKIPKLHLGKIYKLLNMKEDNYLGSYRFYINKYRCRVAKNTAGNTYHISVNEGDYYCNGMSKKELVKFLYRMYVNRKHFYPESKYFKTDIMLDY